VIYLDEFVFVILMPSVIDDTLSLVSSTSSDFSFLRELRADSA